MLNEVKHLNHLSMEMLHFVQHEESWRRRSRPWVALLFAFLVGVITIGCNKGTSNTGDKQAFASDPAIAALPEGAEVNDVTGQALLARQDKEPDQRVRITAILDALRNVATLELADSAQARDTVRVEKEWDGLFVRGTTIRHNGMVMLDSVSTVIKPPAKSKEPPHRWKSFNLRLVEPAEGGSVQFDLLLTTLKLRGIEVSEGRPSGRGLWQERLSIRRWEKGKN